MDIIVSTRHGDLQADSQERIKEKAQKLPRYYDRITAIEVIVDLKNHQEPEVEIKVSAEQIDNSVAKATGTNVISATDSAVQKMERQLTKAKEKLTEHRNVALKHLEPESE